MTRADFHCTQVRDSQKFDSSYPDVDLGDLSIQLSEASESTGVASAALDAMDALEVAVVANYTHGDWVKNASGLSIYVPTRSGVDPNYTEAPWSEFTQWDEMLEVIQRD